LRRPSDIEYIQGVRTGRSTYKERPVSSPAAQRGREVRRRLLTAAVELIPERGWTAVSTRTLAEHAGVTPSVVHYHFPSLQALLREAVTDALNRAAAELEALFDTAGTADGLIEALLAGVDSFTGQESTSLLLVEAYLAATRDDSLREAIENTLSATRTRLAHRLADSGVPDAESTATVLLATLDGLVLYQGLGVAPGGPATVLKRLVADSGKRSGSEPKNAWR
jgi:AcrR family transcriptional regulator